MTNYEINRLLINHLKSMPQAPPILEENMKSTDAHLKASIFLAAYFMPADTQEIDYCRSEQKTGFLQVSVIGKRDKGSKEAQQLADRVCEHFKTLKHSALKINKRVAATAISNETHFHIPISIYYIYME